MSGGLPGFAGSAGDNCMMKGRVALVTGASRGIGRHIADALTSYGARVIAPSRAEMDLASADAVGRYLDRLDLEIDILVNNAGINDLAGIDEIREQTMQLTMRINLLSPLQIIQHFVAGMKDRRYGRIVNISSVWSLITKERRLPYSASKSALNGVTRTLSVELAPFNVLVNGVAPGYVNTDLTRQNNSPLEIAEIAETIPMKRLARPSEIAELVAFMCSEKNSYMTGQVVVIDGGFICK